MSAKLKSRPSKPSRPAAKTASNSRKPLQRAEKVTPRPSASRPAKKPVAIPAVKLAAPKPAKSESKSSKAAKPVETGIMADKDISTKSSKGVIKDRIFLMVPDPFWLHVHWELTLQSVQRAEAALGQDWYGAKPIIRLFDVTSQDTTSTAESQMRDIYIHGGVSHWYIDIQQPPRTYRADIGFLTRRGHFHTLVRSNVVTPPKAGAAENLEEAWAAEVEESSNEHILSMQNHFDGNGSTQLRDLFDDAKKNAKEAVPDKLRKFGFELTAELIITGRTDPTATVKLQNEPVKMRTDGTFIMRHSLTDGRQIIPAIATSADGMEERTIVLAVERNTKHLDPQVHDLFDGEE